MDDYISIKQAAELAGVSTQYLYRLCNQCNKQGNQIYKVVSGRKCINKADLQRLLATKVNKPVNQPSATSLQEVQAAEIELLKAELAIKNKQIEDLSTQNAALTRFVEQSHLLQAQAQQQLLQAGAGEHAQEPSPTPAAPKAAAPAAPRKPAPARQPKKQAFFQRLFSDMKNR